MRVVSLLPSATEIVVALGHGSELVGRSAECDYPPSVRGLRVVMRPRAEDFERSSREIDARVQTVRGRSESLYHLDLDALRSLAPDVILTQDLCGVCSVTEEEVAAACRLAGVSPQILSLTPRSLSDVWESIRIVSRALGDPAEGDRLAAALESRARRTSDRSSRVLVVEWLDPPIEAGLWTPDIVHAAGGTPMGPSSGEVGHRTTWAAIRSDPPDLLILSPCSFSVDRTRLEIDRAGLGSFLDGLSLPLGTLLADEAYFSRPGPRLADGVELIRSLLAGIPPPRPMPIRWWSREEARAR